MKRFGTFRAFFIPIFFLAGFASCQPAFCAAEEGLLAALVQTGGESAVFLEEWRERSEEERVQLFKTLLMKAVNGGEEERESSEKIVQALVLAAEAQEESRQRLSVDEKWCAERLQKITKRLGLSVMGVLTSLTVAAPFTSCPAGLYLGATAIITFGGMAGFDAIRGRKFEKRLQAAQQLSLPSSHAESILRAFDRAFQEVSGKAPAREQRFQSLEAFFLDRRIAASCASSIKGE